MQARKTQCTEEESLDDMLLDEKPSDQQIVSPAKNLEDNI